MQNILVTGGCGFIGTNFIRLLFDNPDFHGRVINVDKLTYAGNPENLADIEDGFQGRYFFILADICDANAINDFFVKYNIDTLCNFAAESHVDRSIVDPGAFIKTNIEGTFTLLEAAREHPPCNKKKENQGHNRYGKVFSFHAMISFAAKGLQPPK